MQYTTNFPAELISEAELETLVATLQKATGKAVEITKVLVVTTEDINMTAMLDGLKDSLSGPIAIAPKRTAGPRKTRKAKKAKKAASAQPSEMTAHQRKIEETGEILSVRELKRRIKDSFISSDDSSETSYGMDGTVVINQKGQRFIVVDGQLVKEPQS